MSNTTTKALARATTADIVAAGSDASAVEKAVTKAMSDAARGAVNQMSSHTLTDGAVNGIVSVASTAVTREVQNIAGTFGGKRARAVATRILGVIGAFGVLAARRGTHAHAVANQSLTVATIDVIDGVHKGLEESLMGGPSAGSVNADGSVNASMVN